MRNRYTSQNAQLFSIILSFTFLLATPKVGAMQSQEFNAGSDHNSIQEVMDRPIKFEKQKIDAKASKHGQNAGSVAIANCSDLVTFTTAKATSIAAISINNTSSAKAVAQYFDAPQSLTVSGFEFYAYKINATGGISINVTAQLFLAGPDSLPTGSPLATVSVAVDTTFGGGVLDTLLKTATFATPILVSGAYCLVFENDATASVGLIFNSYTDADGNGDWLASVDLFGTWTRSYNVNVGSAPFDADALFSPSISYDLEAAFDATPSAFTTPTLVNLTNNSSAILANRIYNQAAFLNQERLSYTWNFGDGSPTVNAKKDTTHMFDPTTAQVVLCDTLFGWTNFCVAKDTMVLNPSPVASFQSQSTCPSLSAQFTDLSINSPTSWLWDFGDGNTSTLQNPVHTYASAGLYTVCLTASNTGGSSQQQCQQVDVTDDKFGTCCPLTLNILGNPIITGTYTAQNSITASTLADANIVFKAGQEILLDPNFEVTLGIGFDAIIESCSCDARSAIWMTPIIK